MIVPSKLVAHRGDPFQFPENTLVSFNSAARRGAVWIEIDIQYTADFVPVLYHDHDLARISGDPRKLIDTKWEDAQQLSASYPERFGSRFESISICKFTELLDSLTDWPDLRIFVELKLESIVHFGADQVVGDIVKKIDDAKCHEKIAAIISKHDSALATVRAHSEIAIGWVLPDFDEANRARAQQQNFDYLFINQKRFDAWQQGLPRQSEQRVAYTINDLQTAQALLDAGADLIETDLIGELTGQLD